MKHCSFVQTSWPHHQDFNDFFPVKMKIVMHKLSYRNSNICQNNLNMIIIFVTVNP